MQTLEIRPFSKRQIEHCSKLYIEIFGGPPWNEAWSSKAASNLLNKITTQKHFIGFVAECNDEPVGYLLGYRMNTVFSSIYYLNELFIDANHQNMKIGKKLVNMLLIYLREKNISRVVLLTKKGTNAEQFYKTMGFKRIPGLSLNKKNMMFYQLIKHCEDGED